MFGGNRSRLFPLACLSLFSFIILVLLFYRFPFAASLRKPLPPTKLRVDLGPTDQKSTTGLACIGPRGNFLDEKDVESLPRPVHNLDVTYPVPTTGSYEALGFNQSWLTFEGRYGPYGFGEESPEYRFSRAEWDNVNWGRLQDDCLVTNEGRFHAKKDGTPHLTAKPRFRLVGEGEAQDPPRSKTGRQAIVIRAWSTYNYQPEDMWNLRSIINEASLATGGEYTVILLVDVKDENGHMIHKDDDFYQKVLEESVPPEFRELAVLFHETLLLNWYKKVGESHTFWQVMQPLQLLAHFYPEFDHYWQIEMDTRFSSHVGSMLQGFHSFSTSQPYKQARERASWAYIPQIHGTYDEFSRAINETMEGETTVWGPIKIQELEPKGPVPPVENGRDDDFEWGVGREADLVLLDQLNEVSRFERVDDWVFKDWIGGGLPADTPRFVCVPAQARASWDLLRAAHRAQHDLGLRVPSEATLPSFAAWHGLKTVSVPLPKFQFPERDIGELAYVLNGGGLDRFKDGIANGPGVYRGSSFNFFVRPTTWSWVPGLPDLIFDHWMKGPGDAKGERPSFLPEIGGSVFAPGLILHPRKTNQG